MGDGYVFSKQFFLTYSWVLVECRYSHVFQNLVHIYSESWRCLQWSHACDQYLHNDQNGHWIRKIFFLLTLNCILVPTIIATPAKPILYNACKENRHGKDFCNSVAVVKYIYIIKGRECRKFRGECGMVLKCPLKHWVEEFGHEF